ATARRAAGFHPSRGPAMARAAGASASTHWRVRFFGRPEAVSSVTAHARLMAHPAYRRLLRAEPIFRRSIPVLIVIFLAIIGAARVGVMVEQYDTTASRARDSIAMIAQTLGVTLAATAPANDAVAYASASRAALANALPPSTTSNGRIVLF